jgi:YjbE family integral membrane protein
MSFASPEFWVALLQIIGINIVLSGDNAVVIALAARSLPADQQKKAIAWGSGAAVLMRIVLTIVAVQLLQLPWLKLVGAGLLLWIALQLLLPEEEGEGHAEAGGSLATAIKTILVADLVMSLDNVIGVAAAAKGSVTLLIIGLAISIPLVIFASTVLLKLMTRFPIIITVGAALLGWVAGEMAVSDPAIKQWVDTQAPFLHYVAPALGALGVVLVGKWMAARKEEANLGKAIVQAQGEAARAGNDTGRQRILLAVDGSAPSQKAVEHVLALRSKEADPSAFEVHLLNVQHSLPGDVSGFATNESMQTFHKEQGDEALQPARVALDAANCRYTVHEKVGEPATTIAATARQLGCDLIVMGSRGHGALTSALIGSVAQKTTEHAGVPVVLAR